MVEPDDVQAFVHRPVMLEEIVSLLDEVPAGEFLDATIGGGGHSAALLASRPDMRIVGLDRDPVALAAAEVETAAHGDRVRLVRTRFDHLAEVLESLEIDGLSGFLFDLGVSSPQLDVADRGFSFRHDGPLDMRMDPDAALTAAEVVNFYDEADLVDILRRNADERFARRIVAAIVGARPIERTNELAEVVVGAIPAAARRTGGHPAKRTFQAIRIEVNGELRVLVPALEAALDLLVAGGRGLVLTYHSGEDRIVKAAFRTRTQSSDPPGLPLAVDKPRYTLLRPASRRPSEAEQAANRRASSARLRSIERLAA